ncbi:pyroglutamyl-peptidase I [Lutibaculum baratangense]|uniref:Pyrrolidone-carboxylate peptidase n=1 Tax=Lutibaculum baratangense AMV1 TaxID=631454 RepID=V4RHJ5_9HYPH|nr:pyroglutamyl-peptidase I [Lutibaculum baratangense]ESR22745.1 peptidase C15, pyroglutamyl peptidase I [Lutibaculum baratangense AMV1]
MSAPTVLVTGFGPFPGAPVNPSAALVRALPTGTMSRRHGIALHTEIMPVSYAAVAEILPRLWRDLRPDAVLHVGLHGRARIPHVELRGKNHRSPLAPDAGGALPNHPAIDPKGPAIRHASLPAPQILAAIRASGARARTSHDAGSYLCNFATYLSLGLAREGAIAGFLHVPWPAEERGRARRAPADRPGWNELSVALEATIGAVALEAKRRARGGR